MTDFEKLGAMRLELGQRIEQANDANGDDLTEDEKQALLLSILSEGEKVPEKEVIAIIKHFLDAKRRWLSLRASLAGFANIRMKDGEVTMALDRFGKELVKQNPQLKRHRKS